MAIKANVGRLTVDIGTTDTTIISVDSPVERLAVESLSIHNAAGAAAVVVELFLSPDTTSASGKRIAEYSIAQNASVDVTEIIGQGMASTENLIAVADTTGANAKATATEYTAGS